MRSHAKASSAGSNSGRGKGLGSLLAVVGLSLLAAACLAPASALAVETRPQIASFGSDGTGSTQFGVPGAIGIDQASHDIYVADYENGTVRKFDENHAPANFSALGSNEISGFTFFPGEELQEIAVNSASHDFYVGEFAGIKAFHQSGEAAEFTAGPGAGSNTITPQSAFFCGVATDANGAIYASTYGAGVRIFKPDGEEITSFPVSEPCNLAVDGDGNVYVSSYPLFSSSPGTQKFTPSAFPVTASTTYPATGASIDTKPTYAVATDPSNEDVYLDYGDHASVFDSSGAKRYEFAPGIVASEGIAIDGTTQRAYVADPLSKKVRVFGPAAQLPSVSTGEADAVAATTATVHGTLNPEGQALTDCYFEFVPDSQFDVDQFESVTPAQQAPCVPDAASIPADSADHAVEADLSGLTPGTAYHYRLSAGTAEGTASGPSKEFITAIGAPLISAQSAEAVGNADATVSAKVNPKGAATTYHVEYGTSTAYGKSTTESAPIGFPTDDTDHTVHVHIGGLTPGTAYHFRFVATNTVGVSEGTDTTFATYPTSTSPGACPNDSFRSGFGARLPDCRAYEQATPIDKHGANAQGSDLLVQASSKGDRVTFYVSGGLPTTGGSSQLSAFLASRGPTGWSSDGVIPATEPNASANTIGFSDDLSQALVTAPGPGNGGETLYLRDSDTSAFELGPTALGLSESSLAGFAADSSHLIFESGAALVPGTVPGGCGGGGGCHLYDLDHGSLTLAGRIPVSPATSCDDANGPACIPAPEGSFAGPYDWQGGNTSFGGASSGRYTQNTISRDGSKVFFTASNTGRLYVREDATKTTQVSASQRSAPDPNGEKPAAFMAATPSGSDVFFASTEKLTDDATTGIIGVGRANIDGTGIDNSFLPAGARGIAVDGSHLYWADPAANTIGRANLDGSGAQPSFITGASSPQSVAVDASHVYWTNAASGADGAGTIGRANLDGTGAEQSFITGASNPQSIAVDGSHIYWSNVGGTEATRSIGRANLDGSGANQALTGAGTTQPGTLAGIALDASHLYWAGISQGSIGRANLDGSGAALFISGADGNGLAVDGSHVYWSLTKDQFGPRIGRANIDGSGQDAFFLRTSVRPVGLALDGSHIYWSYDATGTGRDLYGYDTSSGDLTDLSSDPNSNPRGADVQGVLGASDDGSYVYFVANGALAPGASLGNCVVGEDPISHCNLYVWHDGTIAFIASILGGNEGGSDSLDWAPGAGLENIGKSSRVSADGRTLLFSSLASLTGYDNTEASASDCRTPASGEPCRELFRFRYSAADDQLACVSCSPAGLRPRGNAALGRFTFFLARGPRTQFLHRNLSADGSRAFFESPDALLPADTNDVIDVYEWEAKGSGSCESESQNGGCLYLISSGTSPDPAKFADASSDGDHAFIFTSQQLVPGDRDQLVDVYDAGVGAGLSSQHTLALPTCSSAACQANPAPPPDQPASSEVFSGPGNAHKAPSARKCPKGKRKVRRAGKVSCKKAHKQSKQSKQSKRHNNRGGAK